MKLPNRIEIETKARALRRAEFSRLMNRLRNAISESLRRHHEEWLRSTPVTQVSAAIGTPA